MGGPAPHTIDHAELRFVSIEKHHLSAILPLEHAAYPDPWTQGMFYQEIRNATSHFYLVFEEDTLVAYGGFWMILEEIHITKLTVAPAYRARGMGRRLMGFLERQGWQAGGRVIRLEVRESNAPARKLYEKLGFEEIGIRKNYYTVSPEDAIVMMKNLRLPPAGSCG